MNIIGGDFANLFTTVKDGVNLDWKDGVKRNWLHGIMSKSSPGYSLKTEHRPFPQALGPELPPPSP